MSAVVSGHHVPVRKPISSSCRKDRQNTWLFRLSTSGSNCFVTETNCKSVRKISDLDTVQSDVSGLLPDDTERRLKKVRSIILTAEQLAPFDPGSFNVALLIWCAPLTGKPSLLGPSSQCAWNVKHA